jgi:hypothetical protein
MSQLASRTTKSGNGSSPAAAAAQRIDALTVSDEAIAVRAYEKYVSRGRVHGFDREDWVAAHWELISEAFGR